MILLDEPAAAPWFLAATAIAWTRDPFDRLLAAHAQMRGWRLATADHNTLANIGPGSGFEL